MRVYRDDNLTEITADRPKQVFVEFRTKAPSNGHTPKNKFLSSFHDIFEIFT